MASGSILGVSIAEPQKGIPIIFGRCRVGKARDGKKCP